MKNIHCILYGLLLFFVSCSNRQTPVDMTNQQKNNPESRYEIGKVEERPLSSYVKLPGQLKPFEEVNIYAKANGFVKAVLVDRGSVVKKNQVLLTLEAPEIESQLMAATSKFTQAQENAVASKEKYRRLKEAAKEEGAVAPLDIDNALSKMKADEAVVMSEKSNVSSMNNIKAYLTVTAPFNGTITQRNISSGALVGPGSKVNDQALLVLQQLQKLRLEVFIPEAYVDKVDLKSTVNFIFNAMPGQQHTATISRSANALSSMRSEALEIDIDNKQQILKPGMYAEVKIPLLSDVSSLLVPNNAIVRSTEKHYIIAVKNGLACLVDIKEGLTTDNYTEVFGDIKKGDEILLHATDEIKQNTAIK
ncbi:MAG: efflux RND transporter periplasmic adaptor subunit [Agriterribacter sp.]